MADRDKKLLTTLKAEDYLGAEHLLTEGADPNAIVDGEAVSAMHLAAGLGIKSLCLLLQHNGDPNVRTEDGTSPVHVASIWGDLDCVQVLLDNGGNPFLQDQEGMNALDLARKYGHDGVIQVLQHYMYLLKTEDEQTVTPTFSYKRISMNITPSETTENPRDMSWNCNHEHTLENSTFSAQSLGNPLHQFTQRRSYAHRKNGQYQFDTCIRERHNNTHIVDKSWQDAPVLAYLLSHQRRSASPESDDCSLNDSSHSDHSTSEGFVTCDGEGLETMLQRMNLDREADENTCRPTSSCKTTFAGCTNVVKSSELENDNRNKYLSHDGTYLETKGINKQMENFFQQGQVTPFESHHLFSALGKCDFCGGIGVEQMHYGTVCRTCEDLGHELDLLMDHDKELDKISSKLPNVLGTIANPPKSGDKEIVKHCVNWTKPCVRLTPFREIKNFSSDWKISPVNKENKSLSLKNSPTVSTDISPFVCLNKVSTRSKQNEIPTQGQQELNKGCDKKPWLSTELYNEHSLISDLSDSSTAEYMYTDIENGVSFIERHIPSICGSTGSMFSFNVNNITNMDHSVGQMSMISNSTQDTVLYYSKENDRCTGRMLGDTKNVVGMSGDTRDNDTVSGNDTVIVCGSGDRHAPDNLQLLDNNQIRSLLCGLGDDPGPVTMTTRQAYLKRLNQLENDPRLLTKKPVEYPPELQQALASNLDMSDMLDLEMKMMAAFQNPDPNRRWREGTLKSSFNYILLDPRVTNNLPNRSCNMSDLDVFKTFISAIFYIGKGKRARPYSHLYEAIKHQKEPQNKVSSKVQKILNIWSSGLGVVSLHCFQSVIPVEAFTREACMVDAIGLEHLTNIKRGDYYGVSVMYPLRQRRKMGVFLLKKALQIFINEAE